MTLYRRYSYFANLLKQLAIYGDALYKVLKVSFKSFKVYNHHQWYIIWIFLLILLFALKNFMGFDIVNTPE